jgi:hypothetical protein
MSIKLRDSITVTDESGSEIEYFVEALFDVDDESYALIQKDDDMFLMKIEEENGEQYLVGVSNASIGEDIIDAYQIAVEETMADHK